MDKIQQEFEEWLKSGGNLTIKEDDGQYSFQHTRFAFEAWKASRAELCVELPMVCSDQFNEDAYFAPATRNALDAAGVSYK